MIKNIKKVKKKTRLKLSNELSINNTNNTIIKPRKINSGSLNLKNIISFNNNNRKRVNSFDFSNLNNNNISKSEMYKNTKRKRRNLILRGNNNYRTIDNPSISDSNSSTHNSSAKTQNFSEHNLRKYLFLNEDNLIEHKLNYINRKKNNILINGNNSSTLDNLQNEKDKKDFPKINRHIHCFSSLTDRNYTNNNSRIEYSHHLSRKKNSTPVKLFNTNNNSINSLGNDLDSPKIYNFKTSNLSKNKNILKKRVETPNFSSKLKERLLIQNRNKKMINNLNPSIKGLISNTNYLILKKKKMKKAKTLLNQKRIKINDEYENNKLYYKSDLEIELKKKINIKFEKKSEKNIINRRSQPQYKISEELNELTNTKNNNEFKENNKDNTLNNLSILNLNKIKRNNLLLYNSSSESDSENSDESLDSFTNNIKRIKLNCDISSYFMSPLKVKENFSIFPIPNYGKNRFEKDIICKLNKIEKKVVSKKLNIIHKFQDKNWNLICSYESNIDKLINKTNQNDKTKIQILNSLKIDKKLISNSYKYEFPILKKKIRIKNKYKPLNKNFLNNYLLEKYFYINISQEIYRFHQNFLKNENCSNLIQNFSLIKPIQRRNNFKMRHSKTIQPYRRITIHKMKVFSKENFFFVFLFYIKDYEYYINPKAKPIKYEKMKKKLNWFYDLKSRKKTTKNLGKSTLKVLLKKDVQKFQFGNFTLNQGKETNKIEQKIKETDYLMNALERIDFYKKKIKKTHSKSIELNILKRKKGNKLDKKIYNYVTKYQMISKVKDLKMKMIEKLDLYEIIFFHIKDRNYHLFKSIYEKYKINPDLTDNEGNSLLSLAVQSNSFQIVNYLINCGASVNTKNNSNNTPLHFALSFHNYEIADMLIRCGADEKVINKNGVTPWQCLDSTVSII